MRDKNENKAAAIQHFSSTFQELSTHVDESFFDCNLPKVPESQKKMLVPNPKGPEIKHAVFSLGNMGAQGLMVSPAVSSQPAWIVGT